MVLAEMHRERSAISGTLVAVLLLLMVAFQVHNTTKPRLSTLTNSEMTSIRGNGYGSFFGTIGIVGGAMMIGLAITCVLAPAAAPVILSAVYHTWIVTNMAGAATATLGLAGAAAVAGGVAAYGMDR